MSCPPRGMILDRHASIVSLAQPRGHRLVFLDGLRGWAAFAVVVFHASWEMFGRALPALRTSRLSLLNDGTLAVYVFFVLSGFVLSHQYLATRDLARVRRVAAGRYLRLTIPIAAASLISLALLACHAMVNGQASVRLHCEDWLGLFYRFAPSAWAWLRFSLMDVYLGYDVSRSYGVFLWTMPTELAGSFVIFAAMALAGPHRPMRGAFYALSLPYLWEHQPFLLTFVYGAVLCELSLALPPLMPHLPPWVREGLGLGLMLVVAVISITLRDVYSSRFCGLVATGAVAGTLLSPRLQRLLSAPVSLWLGRMSFPLYIVHSAVICSLSSALVLLTRSWDLHATAALVIPTTLVVSLAAARAFEPVERLAVRCAHRFARLVCAPSRFEREAHARPKGARTPAPTPPPPPSASRPDRS